MSSQYVNAKLCLKTIQQLPVWKETNFLWAFEGLKVCNDEPYCNGETLVNVSSLCRRFLLEWLSYLCRYIPVGLLEVLPQKVGWRPPLFKGRSDLETLLSSFDPQDWIKISEMLLGPVPGGFSFQAKHKSNAYASSEKTMSLEGDQENG